jgi:hydroxyethylthiazole kinase-like uncharacterized protein yjeF
MAQGRDACGEIWWDDLGVGGNDPDGPPATARLNTRPDPVQRAHASHKGSYGDVAVIGGTSGMVGAAVLAARAALHAGAGRVYVGLLDDAGPRLDPVNPELMFRPIDKLVMNSMSLVCGCGGGTAIATYLSAIISSLAPVVIDADALNVIASDRSLQIALRQRAQRTSATVLTPHPLEAARLLGCDTAQIQRDRLKGSGTVIAAPGRLPVVNANGNARLATAGTGDVLAGILGARLAASEATFEAACAAVYAHGTMADAWDPEQPLTASRLAQNTAPAAK